MFLLGALKLVPFMHPKSFNVTSLIYLYLKIMTPSRKLSCKTLPYVLQAPQTSPGDVRTNLPTQTVVAQPVYRQQLLGRPGRITVHLYCPGHAQSFADF